MAKRGKDKLKIGGQLELDVTLKNIKNLEKQLKNARGKAERELGKVNSRIAKTEDPDELGKLGSAKYKLEASAKSLDAAQKQLDARTDLIEKLAKDGKSFSQLTPSVKKNLEKEINGVNAAVTQAKKGFQELSDSTKELDGNSVKALNTAVKGGTNAVNRQTLANNKVTKQLSEFSEKDLKQRAAIQATRLRGARDEQAAQEKLTKNLINKPVASLDTKEQGAVRATLKGRANLAAQRQGLAVSRGKSDEGYVQKLTADREKATLALKDYDAQLLAHNRLQRETKEAAAEAAKQQARIQDLGKAEAAAYAERDKRFRDVRKAERDAYAEQERIDKANQTRVQNLGKAELAAYAEQDKRLRDVRKAERDAYAEQEKIDKTRQSRIQNLGKAESSAYAEKDKRLRDLRKAERDAYAEQERIDKAKQSRIQNLGKAEVAAYAAEKKRISDISKSREKAVKEEELAERKRLALQSKRVVAEDVLRQYGTDKFSRLNYGQVQKQDIKPLLDYAKAQRDVGQAVLARTKAESKNPEVIAAATRRYTEQQNVVRQLENRFRQLSSPLAQVNLLFRQFLRFAVGYGALYQVLGGITALARGVADLDESLRSIQAITGSTERDMGKLERAIKRVATTTKFTTTEISAATQVLGQAGVTAEELPAALEATANFAAATASNLEIAADLITTTRNVFKELDDNTLADQLTKAVNISKLTAQDLKTILSLGAQTAQSYNLTSEQFLGAVTTLRNAGLKASTVATGLRQGLIEVFSPDASSISAIKARYDQLGEEISEEAVKQRFFGFTKADNPLLAVLSELKRLGFADDAQKQFARAFDVRAANALKALINNYDELAAAEVKITFGISAAEAAEIQMRSLNNSLSNLGAAFTVLGDAVLGDAVTGMEKFVDATTDAITELTKLDITLKKQGKDGLGASLLPALFGAGTGALLGKTAKGKLGLGTFGLLAGGASGLAGAGGEGGAGSTAAGAGGTTALALLLGALGLKDILKISDIKKFGGGPQQQDLFGDNSTRGFISGKAQGGKIVSGISGALGKAGGARAVAFIPYIGPVISLVFTLLGIWSAVNAIFNDGGTAAEQANNKLQGTLSELNALEAENEKIKQGAAEFDINAAKAGNVAGKTASTLVDLEKKFSDYRSAVFLAFGELNAEQTEAVDGLLEGFFKRNRAGRDPISAQLKEVSGTSKSIAEIDRVAYDLSSNLAILTDSSEAILGEVSKKMADTYDRILTDAATDDDLAIADLYKNSTELKDVVLGLTEVSGERLTQLVLAFSQGIADIKSGRLADSGASDEDIAKARLGAISAEVTSAILSAEDISEIDLDTQIKFLIDSLIDLQGASADTIANFRKAVEDGIAEAEKTPRRVTTFTDRGGRFPSVRTTEDTEETDQRLDTVARITGDGFIEAQVAKRQEAEEKLAKKMVDNALAQVDAFSELQTTPAGQFAIQAALAGATDAVAKVRLEELLALPNGMQILADEIEASGVTKDLENPQFVVKPIADLVRLLTTSSEQAQTALQGQQKVKEYLATQPDPQNLAQIDFLERRIKNLQGKDKEQIDLLRFDTPDNPINQRRDLLAVEKNKEINGLLNKIQDLDPTGLAATTDLKVAEEMNALQTRLAKARGELLALDEEALESIETVNDKYEAIVLQRRDQAAQLSIQAAEQDITRSGATSDVNLFNDSIDRIDAAQAELLDVFREQLINDGILPGTELFKAELEAREFLLRDLRTNSEKFSKYLEELTSGLREQAALLRSQPITLGAANDARSARQGTVGDQRRYQEAQANVGGAANERAAASLQLRELENVAAVQTGDDLAKTQLKIQAFRQEISTLDQEFASLALTMAENSDNAQVRADAELNQLLATQTLIEGLQDSQYAFKNLAEEINTTFLQAVEGVGEAISRAVLDGDSFKELIGNLLNDIGRKLVTDGIQTITNELATTALQALPAGLTNLIPTAASDAAGGAVEGAALGAGVTAALLPATTGLQLANTNLFLAGTTLQGAATALTVAAAGLAAGAGAEAGAGIIGDFAGAALVAKKGGTLSNGMIKGYAKGSAGIISGPGTGTSDDILAAYLSGGKMSPIRVSDGESILTAKATDALGEDFIHMLNKEGKIPGFNTGALASKQNGLSSVKPAAQQQASITNKNDTTIVNAIDSSSIVAAALETPAGSKAIVNYMRANKSTIQRILQ